MEHAQDGRPPPGELGDHVQHRSSVRRVERGDREDPRLGGHPGHADPVETAAVLTVPVRHFLPDAPVEIVDEERDGWTLRYGAYPVAGYRVWGATGRVLAQLGAVLGPETA